MGGLVILKPGQAEPLHKHTTPMFYYILQGKPIVTLNGIKNRCTKWQCVTIPSNCPHAIDNDLQEEVVILWNYVSLTDKVDHKQIYLCNFVSRREKLFSVHFLSS